MASWRGWAWSCASSTPAATRGQAAARSRPAPAPAGQQRRPACPALPAPLRRRRRCQPCRAAAALLCPRPTRPGWPPARRARSWSAAWCGAGLHWWRCCCQWRQSGAGADGVIRCCCPGFLVLLCLVALAERGLIHCSQQACVTRTCLHWPRHPPLCCSAAEAVAALEAACPPGRYLLHLAVASLSAGLLQVRWAGQLFCLAVEELATILTGTAGPYCMALQHAAFPLFLLMPASGASHCMAMPRLLAVLPLRRCWVPGAGRQATAGTSPPQGHWASPRCTSWQPAETPSCSGRWQVHRACVSTVPAHAVLESQHL